MRRREFLAALLAVSAGCTSATSTSNSQGTASETTDARPSERELPDGTTVQVTEWTDGETDMGVRFSAVLVEASDDVEEPPPRIAFVGEFDDGTTDSADRPVDAEDYGEYGANLYRGDEAGERGWLIFHPPESDEASLRRLQNAGTGESWRRH